MKIAAVQMVSSTDVAANLDAARTLIAAAAAQGASLVVLPEYFCVMGRRDTDKVELAEADGEGPIQRTLAEAARAHRVWLVGGTLPLVGRAPSRVANASLVFSPRGERVARYDKIHLFRYENEAGERYDEARTLEAGTTPVAFDADGWRVGLSVCYDLRFPELYRQLTQPPCDLLCVPSAFTHPTGSAHWHVLLRARAIENQCYVVAAAQGGRHENGRRTYGHTLIVDPWGEVVAERDEGEGIVVADLSRARIDSVRGQLPALEHRRG
jgi:predicted amidohydrolase